MIELNSKNCVFVGGGLIIGYIIYKHLTKKSLKPSNQDEDLEPLAEQDDKFLELKSLLAEPISEGWDEVRNTPGLQVYKKITEASPIAIIKAKIFIPNTCVEDVLFAIWDGEFRRSWDNVIQDFHVIEKVSDDSDLIYFYAQSPMPMIVSNREFVQHRKYMKDPTGTFIVYWSADREDIPVPEGWVRANTIISGYAIKSTEEGVLVDFISQNDVRGKIPPKLINTLAPSKAIDWVKKLSKACASLKSNKDIRK
jgi:START domain